MVCCEDAVNELIQDNVREVDGVVGFDSSQPSVCTDYPLPSGLAA